MLGVCDWGVGALGGGMGEEVALLEAFIQLLQRAWSMVYCWSENKPSQADDRVGEHDC